MFALHVFTKIGSKLLRWKNYQSVKRNDKKVIKNAKKYENMSGSPPIKIEFKSNKDKKMEPCTLSKIKKKQRTIRDVNFAAGNRAGNLSGSRATIIVVANVNNNICRNHRDIWCAT